MHSSDIEKEMKIDDEVNKIFSKSTSASATEIFLYMKPKGDCS
jgi:hypothetical protein